MNHMMSLQDVQHMVDILRPEIIESPTFLNANVLSNLGITALTGIQFRDSQLVYVREAGTTRRYDSQKKLKSTAGKLIERKLEVVLSWNRFVDNIQNYREKEPFSITPENTFNAPNSELAIRSIIASYNEDVFANLFHGDVNGINAALSLYDGYYTHIRKGINDGTVNVVPGANIIIGATDKAANWHSFKAWINALPTRLKAALELIVIMTDEAYAEIIEGYMSVYNHLTNINDVDKPDFRFTTMPNVKCVHHPVTGKGSFMIATVPGNLDFGVDSLNNQTQVFVEKNSEDLNEYMFQIQSAQGTRIRRFEDAAFAVNDADMNTPLLDIQGDYQTGTITLSCDSEQGTVECTNGVELADVKGGTSVALKATPAEGYKFKSWSDGIATATRTFVATGAPTTLVALFELAD